MFELHTWLCFIDSWLDVLRWSGQSYSSNNSAGVQESRDRMTHIKHFAAHLDGAFVSQAFMQELNNYV
jgi:hypothetical protein